MAAIRWIPSQKTVPKQFVDDYSPAELDSFRDAIRQDVTQRRRRQIALWTAACCWYLSPPVLWSLVNPVENWLIPWLVGTLVFLGLTQVMLQLPLCPACRNELEGDFGDYCPACGCRSVEDRGWFKPRRCSSCRRTLMKDQRWYNVRACTHCGVVLDDEGI